MRNAWVSALVVGLFIAGCGDSGVTGGSGGTGASTQGGGGNENGGSPTNGGGGATSDGGGGGTTTTCGDGTIDAGEGCDDGNTANSDGCDDACAIEPGFECRGEPSDCFNVCGDGVVIAGFEDCDDGNAVDGDGCDNLCAVETGYVCTNEPSDCVPDCGDGIVISPDEECDDNNSVAGDGCDTLCVEEHGFTCTGEPSTCDSSCGDGLVASDEACDDSNTVGGDGCDGLCAEEPGYSCTGEPSTCASTCGDGAVSAVEECDDGDLIAGDGCDANCNEETGFQCNGSPSVCVTVCGDGAVGGAEECDDSNTNSNDCCSSACLVEAGCETEPNNDQASADDFAGHEVGGEVNGFVSPSGDANFYSYVLTTPGSITATTGDGILGTTCASGNVDSRIRIFDSTGTLIVSNDDISGTNFCSLARSPVLPPGTYFIAVDASPFDPTSTFDYSITITNDVCGDGTVQPAEGCDDGNNTSGDGCSALCQSECPGLQESEPNDTFGTADLVPANNVQNCAAINPIGDDDFWSFTLTSTSSDILVETSDANGTFTNCTDALGTDTLIELRGTDGTTVLATNDDINGGTNRCSRIVQANLVAGTYFVRVIDFGDNSVIPGYRFKAQITAQCGNAIVEGTEECDGGALCDATCQRIPVCGDGFIDAPETCDDSNVIPGDGCSATCQIEGIVNEVEPNDTTAQADANVVQIIADTTISGAIPVIGDVDHFRVTVAANSVVRFETFDPTASNCIGVDTDLRVLNSAGVAISNDGSINDGGIGLCSSHVLFLAPGTYYVRVGESGNNGTIASYRLRVEFETNNGNETEANETFATANNNLGGGASVFVFGGHQLNADSDFYSVTVPAGGSILAEIIEGSVAETCESNGIDSRLTLYGTNGTTVLRDDDDTGRGFCSKIDGTGTVPLDAAAHNLAAGTYFLQVRESAASGGGAPGQFDYRLVVTVRAP